MWVALALLAASAILVAANEYVHVHTRYSVLDEPDFAEVGF